ncbi:MAG: cysteine/glutathione ABC transporter permease/ATP-binding protein CydD [Desulfosarcina sp.]|nr:cysteine/glutathione ABC transporter permease/ATP-binding protein CydD [Desulfobacterales bacterium]
MDPAAPKSSKKTLQWLFRQAHSVRREIALSAGLGLAGGLLLIVQAHLVAGIVHGAFIERQPRAMLGTWFGLLAGVIALRGLLTWGREVAGFKAGARVRSHVRRTLLERLFRLGPALTRRHSGGGLSSAVMEQVEALHNFYAFYLPQLVLAALIPLVIIIAVFPISWMAAAILLFTAPLIPLFMVIVGMGAESISQKNFQTLSRLSAQFLDLLRGLPSLKRFDCSRDAAGKVAAVSEDYRRRTMQVLRVAFLSSAVLEFFSSVSIALVAVYLGTSYLGYLSFGTYGAPLTLAEGLFILILAPDFFLPLRELGTHYHARAEAAGAAEEILKVFSLPLPLTPGPRVALEANDPIDIRFANVALSFEKGRRPVLNDLSFIVAPGEQIALVGPSGAGKTSVLNLLMGFQYPDTGEIAIAGRPLATLDIEAWRRQLAWIGQQPVLFFGSIRENICLGRPGADKAAVEQAARAAKVTEFSRRLPEGLDTRIGEMAADLSRGQAQRVALARAFLKNAPLLLLDEPTAGLDLQNERLVLEALQALSRNRTVLMVSHRLASIRAADRVLVLSDGRIGEQGPYDALMAARGILHAMIARAERQPNHA